MTGTATVSMLSKRHLYAYCDVPLIFKNVSRRKKVYAKCKSEY